ncbi:MAG: M14 family metallopeptidase [Minisyncoccota bacterium]
MRDTIKNKYDNILADIKKASSPVVVVNACTHGHEQVGKHVLEDIRTLKIKRGVLIKNIANERACTKIVQYIDSDLNRVFPGNPQGDYEHQLAYHIHRLVRQVAVVLDIHSTGTTTVGKNSAIIVTKLDKPTLQLIQAIKPPRVLIMKNTERNALISDAKIGIAFEYGKDNDPFTRRQVRNDIRIILEELGMTTRVAKRNFWKQKTQFYEIMHTVPKGNGYHLEPGIKNFVLIKKGSTIAHKGSKALLAKQDFYPILFGANRYTTIFGFQGKLISDIELYISHR